MFAETTQETTYEQPHCSASQTLKSQTEIKVTRDHDYLKQDIAVQAEELGVVQPGEEMVPRRPPVPKRGIQES